ncbi:MAG TPA: DUF72 domain-containing protein [Haliangiales bacterium]|nr:DUF72 domain-containing protein [Haliangiales bacterium]
MIQPFVQFDRDKLKRAVVDLAKEGVFIGTSSWKYPGWRGTLYDDARYVWHGRFSQTRFERHCLAEYADVFKTVSVDAAYYKFPDRQFWERLVAEVPGDFLFSLKVTDELTVKRFPKLPRFGARAGQPNPNFLDPALFASAFLAVCEPFKQNIGLLMFEFSRFYPGDFARGEDFVEALDRFLAQLPKGWRYGVEIRNRHFLRDGYFSTLARHGVSHIYNSWADMPAVSEQAAITASRTCPEFFGARFLLKPGRGYEEAVRLFSPYQRIREPYPEGRAAAVSLIQAAKAAGHRAKAFIYVNNRFEGNALETISAILAEAGAVG